MDDMLKRGSFTLPGEAGYEDLTLRLAKQWGADVIRDSDGTTLSPGILEAGYDIYSTLCLVRMDNRWARANPDKLQQNYLMSFPVVAQSGTVTIDLLDGYFREQFVVNAGDNPKEFWQAFDRTTGLEVPPDHWEYDSATGMVTIHGATAWHKYTVNFLVCRIWEEISMYNHITNDWGDREHLMAVEPRYPETQQHLLEILEQWLIAHPNTRVVRFTSMFYNFCWFWGDRKSLRFVYSDWGSYDFTVNPLALREFEKSRGYHMTSEDFVNAGRYNATHNPPTARYRDWIDFINEFVVSFGRQCIDLVHRYGKQAYVFYDDHWIGVEPYGARFSDFGFDGIIKCVFNGFEARLGAGVQGVATRELRLHPYLFPTGLTGEPTFKEGGNPKLDAQRFWGNIRRALLRKPVDRIGLGGYLHLVEPFPDFCDYIESLTAEFRRLMAMHRAGAPKTAPFRVAILTAWGSLRSWIASGHMHEHPEVELTQVLESLAGLPVEVEFLSFEDVLANGIPDGVKVLINAGRLGTAWSGGDAWKNPDLVEALTAWVAAGGSLLGIGEPSAAQHSAQYFQLDAVLGVDRETGSTICRMKRAFTPADRHFITADMAGAPDFGVDADRVFVLDEATEVLAQRDGAVQIAVHPFGQGRAAYFSGFRFNPENTRLLHRALYWLTGQEEGFLPWTCGNILAECALFEKSGTVVVINNSGEAQQTAVHGCNGKSVQVGLAPFGIATIDAEELM